MARQAPYRMKIPELVKERIESTLASTMYLVQTTGPTNYVIQEQNSNKKYRVLIGSIQSCSCGEKEICCHLLFVMLKILRVPPSNPVVWQRSLIDSETNMVLTGGYTQNTQENNTRKPFLRKKMQEEEEATVSSEAKECTRHDLVEGEVCAICQEEMIESQQILTFCKRGCGNNFHIDCMKVFGESRKQSKENIICPLCRQDWGDSALNELKKESQHANRNPLVHTGTHCKNCQTKPIRCHRYHCLKCKSYDLCERCFQSNAHGKHSFVMRKSHRGTWFPALRALRSTLLSPETIQDLEGRDLSNADYDMLLELDAAEKYPLHEYLIANMAGLQIPAAEAKGWSPSQPEISIYCTICHQSLRISAAIRSLPCEHTFHESCLLQHLMAQRYHCPGDGCAYVLFPGLHHIGEKQEKKATTSSSLVEPAKPALPSLFSVVSLMKKPDGTILPMQQTSRSITTQHIRKPTQPLRPLTKESNNQIEKNLEDIITTSHNRIGTLHEAQRTAKPTRPKIAQRQISTAPELSALAPSFVIGNQSADMRHGLLPELTQAPHMQQISPKSQRLENAKATRQQNISQNQQRKRLAAQAKQERKQHIQELMPPIALNCSLPSIEDTHSRQTRIANAATEKVQKQKADREQRHQMVKERRDQLQSNGNQLNLI